MAVKFVKKSEPHGYGEEVLRTFIRGCKVCEEAKVTRYPEEVVALISCPECPQPVRLLQIMEAHCSTCERRPE